jgi:4-azaleucine resistance transporter AzlC
VAARTELLAGARAELPLVLGVVPFGLIYGVLAGTTGIPSGAAVAMSAIIFAGSAQFIATQLLASGAPGFILLLTTFVVNLRHVLYSASLAPALRPLRPGWRWLLAYLLTDEAYAVVIRRFTAPFEGTGDRHRHWFFLGAGLTLWTSWLASSAAGVYLGAVIPSAWSLEFMLTLTFIAIVVPMLADRPLVIAAAAASVVSVAAAALPMRLGLMAGAAAGIAAGLVAERRRA